MRTLMRRYLIDRRAVAATEFALILPLMITLYFGGVEISNILAADRKMTSVTATLADLVAQSEVVTNNDMTDIFTAADALMVPFDPTDVTMVVSSVVNQAGQARVAWSDGLRQTPRAVGTVVTLPPGILPTSTSIIMSEVTFSYVSPIGQFLTGGINLDDRFYARPRRSVAVARVP